MNEASLGTTEKKYTTKFNGDTITINLFSYYISNIELKAENDEWIKLKENYNLIKHFAGKTNFSLTDIEAKTYKSIKFILGVDAKRNVSGAQDGALDPSNNMFWDWNTGYIFLKLEGEYKTATQTLNQQYAIHIGGFSGVNNCIRTIELNFDAPITIQNNKTTTLFFKTDLDEFFKNPLTVDMDTYAVIAGGKKANDVANNYIDMFTITKVETE